MPPPPPPDDRPPPGHDPILDDPLFAEIVEDRPPPDLKLERETPPPLPVAEPVEPIPVAEEVELPRATPVAAPPRRPTELTARPVPPPPPRRPEEPAEAPRPRAFAACAVIGCFGLALFGALGFLAYAAIALLSGVATPNRGTAVVVARPEPVAPTRMTADQTTIVLPGYVDAVGRAAGGRYLLLWVSRAHQVVVFDPNTGQLGRSFDVGDPNALIAGSASKLFVYRPNAAGAELERWNLETGEKELTAAKPPGVARPDAIATGAGADGPVFLIGVPANGNATVRPIDPDTLAPADISYTLDRWKGGARTHVRASDDGTLLGVTTAGGAALVRIPAARANATLTTLPAALGGRAPPLATPARDGRLVYTTGGVYDAADGKRKSEGNPYSFPTAHGSGLFLSIDRRGGVLKTLGDTVKLHPAADPDQSVVLAGVEAPPGLQDTDTGDVPPDQRVHVWPAAGVAAVLRSVQGQQQLDVRRVDVPKLLREGGDPYLLFGSEPRLWAVRGQEWRYRPVVWTEAAVAPTAVKADGPRDMTARNGEVVWTPGPNSTSADVVLRVVTGTATAEQRFRVTVVGDGDEDDD